MAESDETRSRAYKFGYRLGEGIALLSVCLLVIAAFGLVLWLLP